MRVSSSCNHHHHLIPEYFLHPKKGPPTRERSSPRPLSPCSCRSTSRLCGFAYGAHFREIQAHSMSLWCRRISPCMVSRFGHVVACINASFLLTAEYYSSVCSHPCLLVALISCWPSFASTPQLCARPLGTSPGSARASRRAGSHTAPSPTSFLRKHTVFPAGTPFYTPPTLTKTSTFFTSVTPALDF